MPTRRKGEWRREGPVGPGAVRLIPRPRISPRPPRAKPGPAAPRRPDQGANVSRSGVTDCRIAGVVNGTDARAASGLLGSWVVASEVSGSLIPTNSVPPRIVPDWIGPTPATYTSLALAVSSSVPEFQTIWPLARS